MYKDVIYNNNRSREGTIWEERICMLLRLSWYQFRLDCYIFRKLVVIPKVSAKKISNEYRSFLSC